MQVLLFVVLIKLKGSTVTKEQLEIIIALISSQQVAISHLSLKIAELTNTNASDLAESFRAMGKELSTKNNGVIAEIIFKQIANGIEIRNETSKEDIKKEITGLLH